MININELKTGDVFSETAYFILKQKNKDTCTFTHHKTQKEVSLSNHYVSELLNSADVFDKVEQVGLLDKVWTDKQVKEYKGANPPQVGDLKQKGIKTLWSEVGSRVFTCCFEKKGKELSKTAYEKLVKAQIDNAVEAIERAAAGKKGVANVAAQILEEVIKNPATNYERGEQRVLRGYKLQHESQDGFYQVVDLDITSGDNKRLVNLNTLQWLVVGEVKYIVE